ncbi:hypothetical protein ACU4GD_08740 [Cupriavidus basilensis]
METSEGGSGGVVDPWVMAVLVLALAGTGAMAAWHHYRDPRYADVPAGLRLMPAR